MVETFLCIFNCGRPIPPPSASKSTDIHQPYDKMVQESSTHFTLHETSRAVTTESIQRQLPPPSAPSQAAIATTTSGEGGENQHRKRHHSNKQYLVNENYEVGDDGPPVRGGHTIYPPAAAASSNAKYNQSKISKSTSNPAQQQLPSERSNPQHQQRRVVEHGHCSNISGNKTTETSLVQNQPQKLATSSRNPQPSKAVDPANVTRDSMAIENSSKPSSQRQHRNQDPSVVHNSDNVVSKTLPNVAKDISGKQNEMDGREGAAYWSSSTGKADLIVHDSSRLKGDKIPAKRNDHSNQQRQSSNPYERKKEPSTSDSHQHHHNHKSKEHYSSKTKSKSSGSNYHDIAIPNKTTSSVANNNTSANISDSNVNTGVNVTGDNCNSDHRHRSKTTIHAMVEPPKTRASKKPSSSITAMVPQHYYLSNTSEIPPPLPSCPPPPLDTPPPTASNLQNTNNTHFSYPSNKSSHNYQSHPSSLDNRKINHSVHGDNSVSRSGNKKLETEKVISPPMSRKQLSNTKYVGVVSSTKIMSPTSETAVTSSITNKNIQENKKSKISTTAVVTSSGSTSSSTVTNVPLESSTKTSLDKQPAPNKNTGAIPKKKRTPESFTGTSSVSSVKPNTSKSVTSSTNQNHLDEIVSFPIDDSLSPSGLNTLSNRTNLPQLKDSTPSPLSSYGSSSTTKHNTRNNQRHYVQ